MKIYIIPVLITTILLCACESHDMSSGTLEQRKQYADAMNIALQNGCLKCHQVKASIIGPSWELVSERYKDAPDARSYLINKVKTGGTGAWSDITGGAIMPPNSPRVSDQHIELLVDFILALKRVPQAQ
jgi:cytochrome c